MNKLTGSINSKFTYKINVKSGARGKSAYQSWLDIGNVGTEEDFIDSLGGGGGTGGTSNYNLLRNKPSIESVELIGNKTLEELGITIVSELDIENLF